MPAQPDKTALYEKTVDVLYQLFGSHPGYRAVHAKGLVCQGTFDASADAAEISRAPHFAAGAKVDITARFSNFAGIPTVSDADAASANPKGLGLKFHLPGDAATDIVAHAANGFPSSTAEEFLDFAVALRDSPPGAPAPTPFDQYLDSHPRAKAFILLPKPSPASFGAETFYGVNAFRFINAQGETKFGRYFIYPDAGDIDLELKQASAMDPNYLFNELPARLAKGPVTFRLALQMAEPGDPTHDGSQTWPETRRQVTLGRILIDRVVPNSQAAERPLIFDPIRLVDGIELGDDPLPTARSGIYSVSYSRRNPSSR
jgi:catalase